MNEIIKRLYQTAMVQIIDYQSGGTIGSDLNVEYFAKLIAREIIELVESIDLNDADKSNLIIKIQNHFEV